MISLRLVVKEHAERIIEEDNFDDYSNFQEVINDEANEYRHDFDEPQNLVVILLCLAIFCKTDKDQWKIWSTKLALEIGKNFFE